MQREKEMIVLLKKYSLRHADLQTEGEMFGFYSATVMTDIKFKSMETKTMICASETKKENNTPTIFSVERKCLF